MTQSTLYLPGNTMYCNNTVLSYIKYIERHFPWAELSEWFQEIRGLLPCRCRCVNENRICRAQDLLQSN